MISREQFEALVRAEAEARHPHYFPTSNREAYIAARMEHEWPLVEAAQALVDRWDTPLWKDVPHTGAFIGRLRKALSPYTTRAAQP